MLTAARIGRTFQQAHWTPLLRSLAANGLILPAPIFQRLQHRPAAVTALALRRLVELSHGRDTWINPMLNALLAAQAPNGAWLGPAGDDPIATAASASALGRLLERAPAAHRRQITDAHHRAMSTLAAMQHAGAESTFAIVEDRSLADIAATSVFILWLLGQHADPVRREPLMFYLNRHRSELTNDTARLWQLVQMETAAPAAAAA